MTITLYKKEHCPECILVESYLLARNIIFDVISVSNAAAMHEVELLTGERKVPVIRAAEKVIVGFQQEALRGLVS